MITHDVSEGNVRKPTKDAANWQMYLVVDGQRKQKSSETSDYDEAMQKLAEWRAEERAGVMQDAKLRYDEIRDDYLESGKPVQPNILRDLDKFFLGMRLTAIGSNLSKFRKWRESTQENLEREAETTRKEIELRKVQMMSGRKNPLTPAEIKKIETEATAWVTNGTKATTDRRLRTLSAMFGHALKETKKIGRGDIPYFPILGKKVDNIRSVKFSKETFLNILNLLPTHLHPFVMFLYMTGMRTGQAKSITWDMIDSKHTLTIPGLLTKNGEPYSLPLTNAKGMPYEGAAYLVNMPKNMRHSGVRVFDTTNLIREWRKACHTLGLGVLDTKTESYRGAQLEDFRHTLVSNLSAKGVGELAAMSVTGHKTASVFKRYGIQDASLKRTALDAVEGD